MKRVLAMLICLILMINIFPTSAFAMSQTDYDVGIDYPQYFESYQSVEALEETVDIDELRTFLFNSFYNCEPSIDISSFNISNTADNVDALKNLIFYEMPECFHLVNYTRWSSSRKITKIEPVYSVTASEYQEMFAAMVLAKDKLLLNIKDNNRLTDAEKALLIHDRLALHCEYDYTGKKNNHNSYGALVDGSAVCQGYTEAYDYLLNEVGIESYTCISNQLNHTWNIVYIDNVPYHVDVTWDDESWETGGRGVVGAVNHENFLRSSKGIYFTGHKANDYDTSLNDTTYDNYCWQGSKTAFQLIDNELYYIDNASETLKRYSDNKTLCKVNDRWKADSRSYWVGNFARLSSNGTELYYSSTKAVYKYDVPTQKLTKIFEPDLSGYNCIYGFEYSDGYLICDINDVPPYSGDMRDLHQIRECYNTPQPDDNKPEKPSFADVNGSSWQYEFASYAYQKGWMTGKGTDANGNIKFDPNNSITREEFVQVLYNAENKPAVTSDKNFPDVADKGWYKNAVLWANAQNIANGMGNGSFGVGMNITRQDLAMMLYKYAKLKGYSLEANPGQIDQYADGSKVSGYAQTAMNWAVKNRILSGKGTAGADISTFNLDPTGTATRAECAAMLKNFMTAFGL